MSWLFFIVSLISVNVFFGEYQRNRPSYTPNLMVMLLMH